MEAFFELARDENKRFCTYDADNNNCLPHFHSNIEIAYVKEGSLWATVSGNTRLLKKGELSVSAGFEIHNYRTDGSSKIQLIIIPVSMVGEFSALARNCVFASAFLGKCKRSKEIEYIAGKLLEYDGCEDSLILKGYLYTLLGYLVEELGLKEYRKSEADIGPVRDILMYVEEHFPEDISEQKTAAFFGYNKYYFSRLFNGTLGCGFLHYVNTIRARHAASLLRSTDMSIGEVCYASGFNNMRTFARAFRATYAVCMLCSW